MRKRLLLLSQLLAFLFVTNLDAQQVLQPQAPTPTNGKSELLKWSQRKPQHSFSGFKSSIPFQMPYMEARKACAVGDGTVLYGNVVSSDSWTEGNEAYGIYSLEATSGFNVQPISLKSELNNIRGVYAKGKYYSFDVQEAFGWLFYLNCSIFNAETWELEGSFDNETVWSNVPYSSTVTYDPQTDQVYGITFNDEMSGCLLSIMNYDDGTFSRICDLSRQFITLAAAPDGVLYAIDQQGSLYTIDKADGKDTYIGTTHLQPSYAQSMTFDPTTGKLYWAFTNENNAALYEVNPTTATAYKIGDMPDGEEIVGMYVKPSDYSAEVPNPVTELKFTPDEAGGFTGTLSCIAPTHNRKGEALTGTITVAIHSGTELLAHQETIPGATISKTGIAFMPNHLYTFYAIATNDAGSSYKQSITLYVGKDNPGAPTNLSLTVEDKRATLEWDAPQRGLNDGYINPTEISYRITRLADSKETLVETTSPGTTQYEETLPDATAYYSYAVTAICNGEEGGTAHSNEVLSVGVYELPFYDNFSNEYTSTTLYTFIDVDNDGHDNLSKWFWKEDERLMQFCSDKEHAGNDWLITPPIHLDAKNLYDLAFNINMGAPSNLKVTIGTSTDPQDHTEILDLNNVYETWKTQHKTTVKVPKEGIYHIGFHAYSNPESFYLNLFDISIEAGMSAEIPDSVYNLKVIPGSSGAKYATLSFNAPKTQINGAPIADPLQIVIYRNEKQVKELELQAGEATTWTDEDAANGNNTYRIVPISNGKEGLERSETVWIGTDIPEAVRNVTARTIDGNMHVLLTWEAPQKGENNGYINIDNVTYSVWRSYDKDNFSPIVQGLKTLTYTDMQIEQELDGKQDSYYYAVTADNETGSSQAETRFLVIGTPYSVPEWESFPNGQFHITPWTTQALQGSFSWECLRDDSEAGVSPQDKDKGFTKFYNYWGGEADSRLKTPVFTLKGSRNPSFSFFMFHWYEGDIEADQKQTKLTVEISVDGGEFEPIGDTFTAAYDESGWTEHRIPLDAYKNAGQVQFGLRGYTNNNWMYYYIDNIRIEEQEDHDLAILDFAGTTSANMNEEGTYTLRYFNRGLLAASDYTLELYQDNILIQTVKGEEIQPGEKKEVTFTATLNAANATAGSTFHANINYAQDGNMENNRSQDIVTSVEGSWYPTAERLAATVNGNEINLSWEQPDIPTEITETYDGAEDYEPFAISNIGEWTTVDGDQLGSGSYPGLPDWPNKGKNQSFIVWAPGYLNGVTAEAYPQLQPRTGDQCLAVWYANTRYDSNPVYNNDYLISPEVLGGSDISFYIRRTVEEEDQETYQIMYSSTTTDTDAFQTVKEGKAAFGWEQEQVTLPEDARYFAIRYTAELQTGILVDDIRYTSAIFALRILGYNVFRDGQKINTDLLTEPAFKDTSAGEGSHAYQVSVVYDRGESEACESVIAQTGNSLQQTESAIKVYATQGHVIIVTDTPSSVHIYGIDGQTMLIGQTEGKTTSFPMHKGIWLVKVGQRLFKAIVE